MAVKIGGVTLLFELAYNKNMKEILKRILPDQITNNYEGNMIAYFVFILIIVFTIVRSLIHLFALDGGAQSIAGFPIDTYTVGAKSMVILMFALWGASQILMGFVYIVVLIKYKSLISAMYVLIFIEYTTRLIFHFWKPAVSTHIVPGGVLDYVMVPVAIFMLILSLWRSKSTESQKPQ